MNMFNGIVGSPVGLFTIEFTLITSLIYMVKKRIS